MREKKTLSLRSSKPKVQETPGSLSTKPKPSNSDSDAYTWLGKVISELYRLGYKVKWGSPLSVNIYRQIREILPKEFITSKNLNAAIRHHVKSPKYLLLLRPDVDRYDVRGRKKGTVTEEQSKQALTQLYEHHGDFMKARRKRRNNKVVSTRKNHVKKHRKNE